MKAIRSLVIIVLALGLTACADGGGAPQILFNKSCAAGSTKTSTNINWAQAEVLNIAIKNGDYKPDQTFLEVGKPAILRIANNDNTPRYFVESDFLGSVVLAQLSVGSATYDRPCISGVSIGPGETAELRLVPSTEGIFYPKDNAFWLLGMPEGDLGIIYVKG